MKEAQTLGRHSTPVLTMNTYARTQADRLSELTEAIGNEILSPPDIISAEQDMACSVNSLESTGYLVREGGLEPPRLAAQEPKSCVYANFTTLAELYH